MESLSLRSRIRATRVRRGLTQTEMANEFKVARNTVTRWEMGLHLPTGARYKQLLQWVAYTEDECSA